MQLEHVHVEAALQAAAVQRLADQLRVGGDLHFREVATAGEAGDQVVVVGAAVGKKAIGQQHHHASAHEPDADADGGEAEQAEGSVAELAAHLAGQQIHRASQQGHGAAEHRGKRQRQQHLRGGDAPPLAPALDHRQQTRHDRSVGYEGRHRPHGRHHQGDHPFWAAHGVGADQGPQAIETAAAEQAGREGKQAHQGDQGGAAEALQRFSGLEHSRDDQERGGQQTGDLRCQPAADEQHHRSSHHHQGDQRPWLEQGGEQIGHGSGAGGCHDTPVSRSGTWSLFFCWWVWGSDRQGRHGMQSFQALPAQVSAQGQGEHPHQPLGSVHQPVVEGRERGPQPFAAAQPQQGRQQ